MASVRIFQVDAFTRVRFSGNPAGVVLDADELSADDMQGLARELNNGDTAFVLRPDADDHDLRVRFFTPRREAAFVGHATLAVHAVLAWLGEPARRRQKQLSGALVEVDTLSQADPARIAIHQAPPAPTRALEAAALEQVLSALGLTHADLDPSCPAVIAGAGSTRVLLGLSDGTLLARVTPDLSRLSSLSQSVGAPGYFLFSLRPSLPEVTTEARMFCPALGIPEDPVSGNAHALLGAYLLHNGLFSPPQTSEEVAESAIEFTGAQGHHMNRPGRVTIALNLEQDLLQTVSILGEATVVFATSIAF